MDAKEKAIDLIHQFCICSNGYYKSKKNIENARKSALIHVDIVLSELTYVLHEKMYKFYEEIKQELLKMKQ